MNPAKDVENEQLTKEEEIQENGMTWNPKEESVSRKRSDHDPQVVQKCLKKWVWQQEIH